MSMFTRYQRDPDGFRRVVELWETTPETRRRKMIEVGMREDPEYVRRVLRFMMTFEDILQLPDLELAELMVVAPPRIAAMALQGLEGEVQTRFLRNSPLPVATEIRDFLGRQASAREVDGARFKLIEKARELEKRGLVRVKQIPLLGTES